jgi:hypothetical protein
MIIARANLCEHAALDHEKNCDRLLALTRKTGA